MDKSRIIVHRANYVGVHGDAMDYLAKLVNKGFKNVEVDLTVTGSNSFKFCHPSQIDVATEEYRIDSPFFEDLAQSYPDVLWVVDITYQVDEPPKQLVAAAHEAFGPHAIFVAAKPALLRAVNEASARTAQFFRNNIDPKIPFTPDYSVYKVTDKIDRELDKVIVICESGNEAQQFIASGAAYVLVDGSLLSDG